MGGKHNDSNNDLERVVNPRSFTPEEKKKPNRLRGEKRKMDKKKDSTPAKLKKPTKKTGKIVHPTTLSSSSPTSETASTSTASSSAVKTEIVRYNDPSKRSRGLPPPSEVIPITKWTEGWIRNGRLEFWRSLVFDGPLSELDGMKDTPLPVGVLYRRDTTITLTPEEWGEFKRGVSELNEARTAKPKPVVISLNQTLCLSQTFFRGSYFVHLKEWKPYQSGGPLYPFKGDGITFGPYLWDALLEHIGDIDAALQKASGLSINEFSSVSPTPPSPSTTPPPTYGADREAGVKQILFEAYKEAIDSAIAGIAKVDCYGCQMECPSQKDHNICCLMSPLEILRLYLEDAMELVDEDKIIGDATQRAVDTYQQIAVLFDIGDIAERAHLKLDDPLFAEAFLHYANHGIFTTIPLLTTTPTPTPAQTVSSTQGPIQRPLDPAERVLTPDVFDEATVKRETPRFRVGSTDDSQAL